MSERNVRERQYRRVVAIALGVSAAIHGAVLGLSSFTLETDVPGSEEVAAGERPEPTFEIPALEVVTLESPSAPTFEPVKATGQAAQRPAVDPTPAAPSPEARIESQIALSMRYDFTTQRSVSEFALQPIQFAGDLDGGDHDEEYDHGAYHDTGGRSWWEGLGLALGIGGGGHCPVEDRGAEPVVISR